MIFGKLPFAEIEYFGSLAELLAKDEKFPAPAIKAFEKAGQSFALRRSLKDEFSKTERKEIRRILNTLYHILLSETGRYTADWDYYESPGILDASKRRPFSGMQVYLEDIRSPFNVGSVFRAAESFGAEKIWLSPLCADPRHKRAERTAMGCVDLLPWERFSFDPFSVPKENGACLDYGNLPLFGKFPLFYEGPFFVLETGGTLLADFSFPPRGILIAGAEELGVSPHALAAADASAGRVTIPCYGAKGSLNVSVAFGIVMQAWAAALSGNPELQS